MEYYFNHIRLKPCYLVNDIGVDFDSLLLFDKHIDRIIAKAYSRIGLLFKGFVSRNLLVFRRAYITYIRPLLEYASNVWSPHLTMHINSLERVQRHFTKRITELHDLCYQERLTVLNLETLEYRRLSIGLTMYYKVFIISLLGLQVIILTLLFHRIIFILFIVILTFVSHCVVLIYLQMIF